MSSPSWSSASTWLRQRWTVIAVAALMLVGAWLVVVQFGNGGAARARPIRISSGEWAPYVSPELAGGGPMAQLVTEIYNRAGYTPEIDYTSWQVAEERVADGGSFAMFPMVGSAERRRQFLLSDPLAEFQYVLFYDRRRDRPQVDSPEAMEALEVGAIAGYDYWQELDAASEGMREYDSTQAGFEALAAGDIDVLVEGLLPGRAVLADPGFPHDASAFDYVRSNEPWATSTQALYLMVPRTEAGADVLDTFNEALRAVRETPMYTDLLRGLEGGSSTSVQLVPAGDEGVVQVHDEAGAVAFVTPRGTGAEVLVWPDYFTRGQPPKAEDDLIEVKLTNGPGQGRVVWVSARNVELAAP